MKIAYVLYPDFTALDLVGPYEIISRWPDAEVHFVARLLDPVRADRGLEVIPTDTPETLPDPDLSVVPGSENPLSVLEDQVLLEWLRAAARSCQWTASVCSGALLYAAAGLLEGKTTTTHWGVRDNVRALGVEVVDERVVWHGTHISGAGVSAGIDMALALTERVHGRELAEALQLVIEYDPQPPFDSGSPTKADARTQRLAKRILLGDRPVQMAARISRQRVGARIGRARRALSRPHANERPPAARVQNEAQHQADRRRGASDPTADDGRREDLSQPRPTEAQQRAASHEAAPPRAGLVGRSFESIGGRVDRRRRGGTHRPKEGTRQALHRDHSP